MNFSNIFNFLLIIFLTIYLQSVYTQTEDENLIKTIKLKKGSIRGKKLFTQFDKKPYYAFKGIPYAKPPINELRFKPPQKHDGWSNVIDAFEFGNECMQTEMLLNFNNIQQFEVLGNEDCLFLNVYTPDPTSKADLTVMVFIHGGAFIFGSSNMYGPDFLVDENVILVTINYRLGPFGFMSLGSPDYSGNMGLKDQQLALKWITDNIKYFGGDNKKITLFGQSAGAASTHYHIISKESRSMFKRAILMSGSVFNTWSSSKYNEHMLQMFAFAMQVKHAVDNTVDLIKYLNIVDAQMLIEYSLLDLYVPGLPTKTVPSILWAPVVEHEKTKKPFTKEKAHVQAINKNFTTTIDVMLGITSDENLMFIGDEIQNPSLLKSFNDKFAIQLPLKDIETPFESEEYKQIAAEIRKKYFGENGVVNEQTLIQYNNLLSDVWFNYGMEFTAKLHSRKSLGSTYFYKFSVDSDLNDYKKKFKATGLPGASHGDELCYIFRCNFDTYDLYENITKDSISIKTIKNMAKLWTNFAKTGNPTPLGGPVAFKEVTKFPEVFNYLDITNDGMIPGVNPRDDYLDFWTELFQKNYNWLKSTDTTQLPKDEL